MKTKPFNHQQTTFNQKKNQTNYALFWEQGCGKTKTKLDISCHKYHEGVIDALLVIAPKAVHPNWAYDEIPIHLWDDVPRKILVWDSKKTKNKSFSRAYDNLLKFDGLAIITMNYEALLNKKTFDRIKKFLTERNVDMVCDESHRIKSPKAQTTKAILKLGKFAKCRSILTGTSVSQSPFDIYTQFKFMDESVLGFTSYYSFKNYFGAFMKMPNSTGGTFDSLVEYRNLDFLKTKIKEHSSRVLKEDVLDLPKKIYQKRYIDMPPAVAKVYKQMKKEFLAELESGEVISAPLIISKMGKLQQIVCGFIFDEQGEVIELSTARVDALIDSLPDKKCIIWHKFKYDEVMISRRLDELGIGYVTFNGSTSDADRELAKKKFKEDDDCRIFLANPKAAREGLTLTSAKYTLYYNRDFSLVNNLQSEDRNHRIGQDTNVTYIDFVMKDTIDEAIINNLRSKNDMATNMNSDNVRNWV